MPVYVTPLKKKRRLIQIIISRRRFVKHAAIIGAGITAFPLVFIRRSRAAWARKTVIHPNVDNLRVVGITDPGMTKGVEPKASWSRQDELVKQKAVWENIEP